MLREIRKPEQKNEDSCSNQKGEWRHWVDAQPRSCSPESSPPTNLEAEQSEVTDPDKRRIHELIDQKMAQKRQELQEEKSFHENQGDKREEAEAMVTDPNTDEYLQRMQSHHMTNPQLKTGGLLGKRNS